MASNPVTPTSSLGSPTYSTLPSLKTVALQPKVNSQPLRMDTALLQIDRVEVAKVANQDNAETNPLYVVNVFFSSSRGIQPSPTLCNQSEVSSIQRSNAATETECVPDLQVVHKLSEFAALRDKIQLCVRPLPREEPTTFCSELTEFLSYSSARATVFQRATKMPSANASPLLVTFLERTLGACKDLLHTHRRTTCRGERHALALVLSFLLPIRSSPQ